VIGKLIRYQFRAQFGKCRMKPENDAIAFHSGAASAR